MADTNGGTDTINASAVSSNSIINLNAGTTSIIDGVATTIAAGTVIEYAIGGDGDDTLVGNAAANSPVGYRGNDTVSYESSTGAVTVSLARPRPRAAAMPPATSSFKLRMRPAAPATTP